MAGEEFMKKVILFCLLLNGYQAFAGGISASTTVTGILTETNSGFQIAEVTDMAGCATLAQVKADGYCFEYDGGSVKTDNVVINISSGCARGAVMYELEQASGALVHLHGQFILSNDANGKPTLLFDARGADVISK
jgi:hypothetical protein